jgi:hypothetical protein
VPNLTSEVEVLLFLLADAPCCQCFIFNENPDPNTDPAPDPDADPATDPDADPAKVPGFLFTFLTFLLSLYIFFLK